ncbi:unnamed protein product [Notodromas monacha]|uniref:Cystatin domain-containing protein n=1 Tax=Notodromas monacha TaxID=399045 RepID=A0A7R9G827_9CRUS|nr:unnamed protein product [Notodromas monacha]CAG0912681.1 unnamed protein product [Notodromas monacha]
MVSYIVFGACVCLITSVASVQEGSKQPAIVGGPSQASVDDEAVKEILGWAEGELVQQTDSLHSKKIFNVLSVTKQVVAGMRYTFKTEFAHADDVATGSGGTPAWNHTTPHVYCEFSVWDRPWLPSRVLQDITCSEQAV